MRFRWRTVVVDVLYITWCLGYLEPNIYYVCIVYVRVRIRMCLVNNNIKAIEL